MALIDLTGAALVSNTGWTNPLNSDTSDNTYATCVTAGSVMIMELDDVPGDFGSANSIRLGVEWSFSGTASRRKAMFLELVNAAGAAIMQADGVTPINFNTGEFTNLLADTLHQSVFINIAHLGSAALNGARLRATMQEGGGMADGITVRCDYIFVTLDYNAAPGGVTLAVNDLAFGTTFDPVVVTVGSAALSVVEDLWKIRNDDGTEITATSTGGQFYEIGVRFRLRIGLVHPDGIGGSESFKFQFAPDTGGGNSPGAWQDIGEPGASGVALRYAASPNVADGQVTTRQMYLAEDPFVAGEIWEDGGQNTPTTFNGDGTYSVTEHEIVIELVSGVAVDNQKYHIRTVRAEFGDLIDGYNAIHVFADPASAGGVTLVVADLAFGTQLDAPVPSANEPAYTLAPADLGFGVQLDTPVLSANVPTFILAPADLQFATQFDAPVLSMASALAPEGLAFAVLFESVAVTEAALLAVADMLYGTQFDAPVLTEDAVLAVAGLNFATLLDSLTLSTSAPGVVSLTVSDLFFASSIDSPNVLEAAVLAVAGMLHGTRFDGVALVQGNLLAVEDLIHGVVFDAAVLVQASALAVQGHTYGTRFDAVAVVQGHFLSPDSSLYGVGFETVTLLVAGALDIASIRFAVLLDSVAVTEATTLLVQDLWTGTTFDNVSLAQATALAVAGIDFSTSFDTITLQQGFLLTVADLRSGTVFDTPVIIVAGALGVQDLAVTTVFEAFALQQANLLVVNEAMFGVRFETPMVGVEYSLEVQDLGFSTHMDPVVVTAGVVITTDGLTFATSIEEFVLTQAHLLTVEDLRHGVTIEALVLRTEDWQPVNRLILTFGYTKQETKDFSVVKATPEKDLAFVKSLTRDLGF